MGRRNYSSDHRSDHSSDHSSEFGSDFGSWAPYVPVAQRQRQAQQKLAALNKKGQGCQPVAVPGRAIAQSFWGKAWCDNLESYSDYANRLPRGRSYLRHGAVIDLRIEAGKVQALVCGSEVYRVEIGVQPLEARRWQAIVKECSGQVASVIELLQGRLSTAVMETVTRPGQGLFPQPRQITLRCSCPDAASLCKHVAAALYGVGARLDSEPELLFRLRHADPQELIRQAGSLQVMGSADSGSAETTSGAGTLDGADLSALFGIDVEPAPVVVVSRKAPHLAKTGTALPSSTPDRGPKAVAPGAGVVTRGDKQTEKRSRSKTVTPSDLLARGVARHMIQSWLASGVLLRTEQRGVYRTTAQTETRIAAYVARGAG